MSTNPDKNQNFDLSSPYKSAFAWKLLGPALVHDDCNPERKKHVWKNVRQHDSVREFVDKLSIAQPPRITQTDNKLKLLIKLASLPSTKWPTTINFVLYLAALAAKQQLEILGLCITQQLSKQKASD